MFQKYESLKIKSNLEMFEEKKNKPISTMPEKSDILFNEMNADYRHNAIIRSGISQFFLYSDSYKYAAVKLFEQLDGNAYTANMLVYPLVFLNRHFIELRLKELISGLNYAVSEKFTFPDGHNIENLWNTYKGLIPRAGESYVPDKLILDNAEKLILEFNQIDPNSMCFRYPVDKNRDPNLKMTNLDLENFRVTMDKLFYFFDVQSDLVFHIIDVAQEFYDHMREQYHKEMNEYYFG